MTNVENAVRHLLGKEHKSSLNHKNNPKVQNFKIDENGEKYWECNCNGSKQIFNKPQNYLFHVNSSDHKNKMSATKMRGSLMQMLSKTMSNWMNNIKFLFCHLL